MQTKLLTTKTHTLKEWFIAVRPWSFPASAMPVVVTLAFLHWNDAEICWTYGIWALINIIIFHAAGNTWSDYYDYIRGVDAEDTYGTKNLTGGLFTPEEIHRYSLLLLIIGVSGGLGLVLLTGTTLLWIGIAGAACTLLYPYLKYHALGDVVIAITYGWLPTWGTSFVATGSIDYWSTLIAVPVGLITIAILHANNSRDVITDQRASISTIAMHIGHRKSQLYYACLLLVPYACILFCSVLGYFPWLSLITLVTLPISIKNIKRLYSCNSIHETALIDTLDEDTAKLQLLFSLTFAASFIIVSFS